MKVQEFSSQFDTLLNSYARTASFGEQDSPASIELDEYEKSLFLTNAQDEVVISLYSGRNSAGSGFEETEEVRRYLSKLISEAYLNPITTTDGKPLGIESTSKFFTLPEDVMFITYESVNVSEGKCGNSTSMEVVPVRQDEYHKIKNNPFRGANDRRALRFDLSEGNVEIVCKYVVDKYYIRYLKQLDPIILTPLKEGIDIKGKTEVTDCKLDESLHYKILERAVQMALQSRGLYKTENK